VTTDDLFTFVACTSRLILQRDGATLATLRAQVRSLLERVLVLPNDVNWPGDIEPVSRYAEFRVQIERSWPELGCYDAATGGTLDLDATGEVGDAVDDLTDIVVDLDKAGQLACVDEEGARSWLRFAVETHWGVHARNLDRHLDRLAGQAEESP